MPRLARRQPAIALDPTGFVTLANYVHRIGFSPDGTMLAACSASGEVAVWDVPSLRPAWTVKGHAQSALTLAWNPFKPELASGGQDGVLRLWKGRTGETWASLPIGTQGSWVEQVAWSPDGTHLAASAGKLLRIWNTEGSGIPPAAAETPPHKTTVSALAWMPQGGGVIGACYGGAWLWKIGQAKPVRPFPYEGALLAIALSPGGEYLASGNLDGSVHLFRTDNQQNWHMAGYPTKVTSVRFDYNGLNLFTAAGPALVSWNMKKFEGTGGRLFKGHLGWIREIACHPNRSIVATAGEDGLLCLWEPQTTKPLVSLEVNREGGLSCVAWSAKQPWLAAGTSDGAVHLFSVQGIEERA